MVDFDAFSLKLLEEAKRFLERALEAKGSVGEEPNLHAALMLSFCSLEAHVNAVSNEMSQREGLSPHALSVLLERDVSMSDGKFQLDNRRKIFRLEDRIYFLHGCFGTKPDLHGPWRSKLAGAIDLRNKLTHPKGVPSVTIDAVKQAVQAVVDTIDALYRAVYDKPFPVATWELASKLDF